MPSPYLVLGRGRSKCECVLPSLSDRLKSRRATPRLAILDRRARVCSTTAWSILHAAENGCKIAAPRRVCSLCIPQRCNRLLRRAACAALRARPPTGAALHLCTTSATRAQNGAPSPTNTSPPRRATLVADARRRDTSDATPTHRRSPARNARCTHNTTHRQKKQS